MGAIDPAPFEQYLIATRRRWIMKVKQLINQLQQLDPELIVATAHYEFGLTILRDLQIVPVLPLELNQHENCEFRLIEPDEVRSARPVVCLGPLEPALLLTELEESTSA